MRSKRSHSREKRLLRDQDLRPRRRNGGEGTWRAEGSQGKRKGKRKRRPPKASHCVKCQTHSSACGFKGLAPFFTCRPTLFFAASLFCSLDEMDKTIISISILLLFWDRKKLKYFYFSFEKNTFVEVQKGHGVLLAHCSKLLGGWGLDVLHVMLQC